MQLMLPDRIPDSLYLPSGFLWPINIDSKTRLPYIAEDMDADTAPKYSM